MAGGSELKKRGISFFMPWPAGIPKTLPAACGDNENEDKNKSPGQRGDGGQGGREKVKFCLLYHNYPQTR